MISTDWAAYGLALAMGGVIGFAPNTVRLYWRFMALPTGIIGAVALALHDEALFSLTVRLWIAGVIGVVLGLLVDLGPWWGRGDDDETPEPPGPDPEDHRPEAEPVVDEVASSVRTDTKGDAAASLNLWAEFEATPAFDPATNEVTPVDRIAARVRRGRRD